MEGRFFPARRAGVAFTVLALGLFFAVAARADELVVDDSGPSVRIIGDWAAVATTPGFHGDGYRYRVSGDGVATVTWPFPSGAAAGRYEVFARWTSGANRASNAPYRVAADTGATTIAVDQRTGGGAWLSLGTFAFQSGHDQGVTLADAADGVVVADAVRWVGPLAPGAASELVETPSLWVVTFRPTEIRAGPFAEAASFATLRRFSYLRVMGYEGDWAYVHNPLTGGPGYVRSDALGPAEPPPAWYTAPPPPAEETFLRAGRTVGAATTYVYPVDDEWAVLSRPGTNTAVTIVARVRGLDNRPWYRTADGGYLPADAVRLPRTPPRTFGGRWIDVDLAEPALLTAYEGDTPVLTTLAIHGTGRWQTPTGVFRIERRVASETMDSATIGIPRGAPGGYYLTGVLYTQYFLPTGESLHYNYWSANWGYPGSHGCLGLPLAESEFLWHWADVGTPISIHT